MVKTEPNLVQIFRGAGRKLFFRHIFMKCSPGEEKRNQVSIQKKKKKKKKRKKKKKPKKNYGAVVKVVVFVAKVPS